MEGSPLPSDWKDAYVNVCTSAVNLKEAIELVENSLRSDKYNPVDTYAAWEINVEEYNPNPEDYEEMLEKESSESIQRVGGLFYSAFHAYLAEEED